MTAKPKVVVVMPAYNAEKTLHMTYQELPKDVVDLVILVDDASQDDTIRGQRLVNALDSAASLGSMPAATRGRFLILAARHSWMLHISSGDLLARWAKACAATSGTPLAETAAIEAELAITPHRIDEAVERGAKPAHSQGEMGGQGESRPARSLK